MTINLQQLTYSMFRSNFDRRNNINEFKPYFYRFIGVSDINNFDNVLKTIKHKCKEHEHKTIIFDNSIPLSGEMELIQYIYNEIVTMDIFNMEHEEISLFSDININNLFLKALDYVIPLAIANESFFNESVRNNFITKLIVWGYTYLRDIDFQGDINPKCFYYGVIQRHEIYFLIIMSLMGFDVIYINPLKEEFWETIDKESLSKCIKEMNILSVESFAERAANGVVLENNETITKQIQRDIESQLFSGTGMFKPWQFRKGYTESMLLDTIVEDIFIYWNEPCKLRHGFMVQGSTVRVPCFFKKIDGEYSNINEYERLVKYCVESENTLFFNSGNISKDEQVTNDMYGLMFCQLSDGTFDIEEIKKSPIYRFGKYSEEVQNFLLNKFNETILDSNLYVEPLDREMILKLLVLVISLNDDIVRLVDNFDFTGNIPKIVIYLDNEDTITEPMMMLLGYIHTIGMDIVIFNPSGLFNINKVIKHDRVNVTRLDQMNYKSSYKKLDGSTKANIFSRLFK